MATKGKTRTARDSVGPMEVQQIAQHLKADISPADEGMRLKV